MSADARPALLREDRPPVPDTGDDAARELKEFTDIVAHDLGGSFRLLAEFSRLLLGEPAQTLTDRQRAFAEQIRAASLRCQAMMEQLSVFSHVQQKVLAPISQDATRVVQLALLQLSGSIRAADAEVFVQPLGEVYADPDLLALAVWRLLDNAVTFRRPSVPLKIRVDALVDETSWTLRVVDNGLGVEPVHREKVFRMFYRNRSDHPGVGAGLTICRRIARRQGGEVRFTDAAEGACVELVLPRSPVRP